MRKHGLTVDNLRSVELVTPDGEQLHVDDATEPELFWGLRGGGGNFGIATSFEFQLHPVGPLVLAGPIVWPIDDAPEVLAFLDSFAPEAPDELGLTISMMPAPPLPFLPMERFGEPVILVLPVWAGDLPTGEEAVAPLKAVGSPLAAVVRPSPYVAVQGMLDGGAPHGRGYYWKAHRYDGLGSDAIDTMMAVIADRPATFWQINGWAVGGAVSRVPVDSTAVGHREPGFELNITTAWPPNDPNGEAYKEWVRDGWERLEPFGSGVYANFISDEGTAGVESAYGDRLERLTALKDRWDPTNFLRLNANIPPSEGGTS
jgi:FAD/FMN-containing dehydrogenase